MVDPLRIAVVATPRSGNTWLRALLHHAYELPVFAVNDMSDAFCESLPQEAVVQVHWRRTPEFTDRLRRHRFRVLTVARHPLDVLISILHFCWYEPETRNWLLGEGGSEEVILAAMPRSRPFVEYANGPRAAVLLAVTTDWWDQPDVTCVRYEQMVADPLAALVELSEHFGPIRNSSPQAVVDACSMSAARKDSLNNHFWKGQPGLWRSLLPTGEANEILAAIRPACEQLGYDAEPDTDLTAATADANWVKLTGRELSDTVQKTTIGFRAELNRLHTAVATEHAAMLTAVADAEDARRELAELIIALTAQRPVNPDDPPPPMRKHLGETAGRIEQFFALQGLSVKLAVSLQHLRDRVMSIRRVGRPPEGHQDTEHS